MNHQYDYLQMFECIKYHLWLVVWNIFYFFHILEIIIPTDELHHFSEGWLNQISQISLQSTIRTFAMKCRSSEIPFRALSSAMAMVVPR